MAKKELLVLLAEVAAEVFLGVSHSAYAHEIHLLFVLYSVYAYYLGYEAKKEVKHRLTKIRLQFIYHN